MKRSIILAAGLISISALTTAYADDVQTPTPDAAKTQIAQRTVNDPSAGGRQSATASAQRDRTDSQDRDLTQYESPTGSDPATGIPYAALRGRLPFARGEAQ